jgi:predicted phage replisome organizer
MSENKRYYFLKLKEDFLDSQEIKVLESRPNGICYSNLLVKLYLKSLKHDGALKLNEEIAYDEKMIAALTNLKSSIVKSGLQVLESLKLIERLDNGTIYMSHIQSFIGKSTSEADRKRFYREKIEEEKLLPGKMTSKPSEENGTSLGNCPPENRDIENISLENIDKDTRDDISIQSISLLKDFEARTGGLGNINLAALKEAVEIHGAENVKSAIDKALEKNKVSLVYINGILRNWAREGYPKEGDNNGNRSTGKDNGADAGEFAGFKPSEPRALSEEERKLLEGELL